LGKAAEAATTVGATTPFTILEGEAGTLGGGAVKRMLQTIPQNALSSPELEASGRGFAELSASGALVSWVNHVDSCNTINIRQAIPLTSRQTWVYDGNNGNNNGMSQTPSTGGPHVFYDESRTLITGAALNKGDTIMLNIRLEGRGLRPENYGRQCRKSISKCNWPHDRSGQGKIAADKFGEVFKNTPRLPIPLRLPQTVL